MDLTRGVAYGPEFRGDYEKTSAPTVLGDLVITGSSIGDNGAVDMPRGVVNGDMTRAYRGPPVDLGSHSVGREAAGTDWRGERLVHHRCRSGARLIFIPTGSGAPARIITAVHVPAITNGSNT